MACPEPRTVRLPSTSVLDRLGERALPHYGQLVLWTLILLCVFLTTQMTGGVLGVRGGATVSILSFLPDRIVFDADVSAIVRYTFFGSASLWLAQRLLPWSSWVAALSFTLLAALYEEQQPYVDHVFHLTNMVLWIYALWFHFYAEEIRKARASGLFYSTPLFPRWVYTLTLFYVGLFYTLAGLAKLVDGGLDWANGVSMQLWTLLWGKKGTLAVDLILSHRALAKALQWGALIFETGAILMLPLPRLRPVFGLGLIGFHLGQYLVFGWAFHGNVVLIALTCLPPDRWIERGLPRWSRPAHSLLNKSSA